MCRLQTALEIRKRLHKLSHIFPRSGIDIVPRAQVADSARKEPFNSTYHLQREVCDGVTHERNESANLVAHECTKVNMFKDEVYALNLVVQTCALAREYAGTASRFALGKRNEPPEKCSCDEDENERYHG